MPEDTKREFGAWEMETAILAKKLPRVAAARVWNAMRVLMKSLGDAYVIRQRVCAVYRNLAFVDREVFDRDHFGPNTFHLCLNAISRYSTAPLRDLNALAQREA